MIFASSLKLPRKLSTWGASTDSCGAGEGRDVQEMSTWGANTDSCWAGEGRDGQACMHYDNREAYFFYVRVGGKEMEFLPLPDLVACLQALNSPE